MKGHRLFGIYHTDCRKDGKKFRELADSDFINVFLVEGDRREPAFSENFEILKGHPDKGAFISVVSLGFVTKPCAVADVGEAMHVPDCLMYPDYRDRVDSLVRFLKEKGYYDSVIGFYVDEPMLWGMSLLSRRSFGTDVRNGKSRWRKVEERKSVIRTRCRAFCSAPIAGIK